MVKFGVALENFVPPGGSVNVEGIEAYAAKAEELGFESVWAWDHLLLGSRRVYPILDSVVLLSYLAARTSRIRLGTMYILPLRKPLVAAKALSGLSYVSRGRLMVAVAAGWYDKEFYAVGADYQRRGKVTSDYLKALKRLLYEDDVNGEIMDQRFVHVTVEPKPQSRIPIFMGGYVLSALRRAARLSDGWMSYYYKEEDFGESVKLVREFAAAFGRRPEELENSDMIPIYIGEGAEEKVKKFTEIYTDLPKWSKCSVESGIHGSLREAEERVERYIKAGADRLIFIPAFYEPEQLEVLGRLIQRFAQSDGEAAQKYS